MPKLTLALCLQPLMFVHDDRSLKMVEWMEMLRMLKYEKVTFRNFTLGCVTKFSHLNIVQKDKDILYFSDSHFAHSTIVGAETDPATTNGIE